MAPTGIELPTHGASTPYGSSAAIFILSSTLTSAQLANEIGMTPDRTWDKGELAGGTSNRSGFREPYSGVSLENSSGDDTALGLEICLRKLLDRMAPIESALTHMIRRIAQNEPATPVARLWLNLTSHSESVGLTLDPVMLGIVANLGLQLEIAFTSYPQIA